MANNLAANTPIKYSLKLVELLYNETIYNKVTNTDYEGEIKKEGDRVRVRTLGKLTLSAYTKEQSLSSQNLTPTQEDLIVDQQYYFKFVVDDIDALQNDVDTVNEYAKISKRDMAELIDTNILAYMRKNAAGANAAGTAYSTGTIGVTTGTGAVAGSGTTFTAAMVGGYFTADAGVTYYLVTAFGSTTSITVTDLDGVAYTGGTIATSTAYTINSATAVAITKSNIYAQIVNLKTLLSQSLAPLDGRFLVVNALFEGILLQAPEFIPAVGSAYDNAVKGGKIGRIAGFDVYSSELVDGDNTTGYWFIAGTRDFCAFALQIMKVNIIPSSMDSESFVDTCKGLLVWGRKVFEGNRARGAVLRATLS
jgi:hypothetical protein